MIEEDELRELLRAFLGAMFHANLMDKWEHQANTDGAGSTEMIVDDWPHIPRHATVRIPISRPITSFDHDEPVKFEPPWYDEYERVPGHDNLWRKIRESR